MLGRILQNEKSLIQCLPLLSKHFGWRSISVTSLKGAAAEEGEKSKSWVPSWLRAQLPGVLGGTKEASDADFDLETYYKQIKRAQRLGGLTGFVNGANTDSQALGVLRKHSAIIGLMTPEERSDLKSFGPAQRQRIAQQLDSNVHEVDDCIKRFLYLKVLSGRLAQLKKEGKEVPTDLAGMQKALGASWNTISSEVSDPGASELPGGDGLTIPVNAMGPRGYKCPYAGSRVPGRNQKCQYTKKSFKSCCLRTP